MSAKKETKRLAGFTLVELTVVIAILSLVALLVIPRLPSATDRDLKGAARNLAATVRYLTDLAVTTKTGYRLRLNLAAGNTEITRILPEDREAAARDSFLHRQPLREGIVFADITAARAGRQTAGTVTLDFSPLGVEDFVLIHLKAERGDRYYTVALYPGSGRVEVSEGYQEGVL